MNTEEEYAADRALITHLVRLHEAHDKKSDNGARGKLANLRYAMRDHLHAKYPYGRVVPALTDQNSKVVNALTDDAERNEWRTLIAGLYGYAHDDVEDRRGVSLGTALRSLYEARQNDSLERRFMALLNADAEHLPGHLRQAISLLKAEKIGIDWGKLLEDACAWDAPDKHRQKKWIRDYYRSSKAENTVSATDAADTAHASEE